MKCDVSRISTMVFTAKNNYEALRTKINAKKLL